MGSLKDEQLKNANEDIQQHKLNDPEANYLRLLNIALQYHTMGQKIMSGFLYYVCTTRLGYKDGVNLQFEFNFENQDNVLTVRLLPENFGQPEAQPAAAAPAPAPAAAPAQPEAPAEQPAPGNNDDQAPAEQPAPADDKK